MSCLAVVIASLPGVCGFSAGVVPKLLGRGPGSNLQLVAARQPSARLRPGPGIAGLKMQRRPGDRKSSEPLTALQMTMTRPRGFERKGGGGDRFPQFFDELQIVAACAVIGGVTGFLVSLFKAGITTVRSFTYDGPWASFVDSLEGALKDAGLLQATDPHVDVAVLTSVPEGFHAGFALYPVLGGLITTLLLVGSKAVLNTGGFGVPLAGQLEELQRGKEVEVPRFVARNFASVSALGTGCSLGPEGPSVEMGITVSRLMSQLLGNDNPNIPKVFAAAGAAAGVSAGFNAPLTGVVFALEILLPSLNAADIANAKRFVESAKKSAASPAAPAAGDGAGTPCDTGICVDVGGGEMVCEVGSSNLPAVSKATAGAVLVASALSCFVARSGIFGPEAGRFTVENYQLVNYIAELPFYMTLGIMTGGVAAAFRRLSADARSFYGGQTKGLEFMGKVPPELRPLLGASLCGLVATRFPGVLFFGYDVVNSVLKENTSLTQDASTLLTLLALKVSLTASCVGSGLMGGVFAPSLFFGATLGAAYEDLLRLGLGLDVASASSYAAVGAAAVLASVFRAPVTGILLMFELTRNYDIVLPLIATVAIGTLTIDLIEVNNVDPTWGFWWEAQETPVPVNPSVSEEEPPLFSTPRPKLVQVGQGQMSMRKDESKWELEGEVVGEDVGQPAPSSPTTRTPTLSTPSPSPPGGGVSAAAVVSATTVASATVAAASAATRAKPMPSIEECRQAQDSCGSDGSA